MMEPYDDTKNQSGSEASPQEPRGGGWITPPPEAFGSLSQALTSEAQPQARVQDELPAAFPPAPATESPKRKTGIFTRLIRDVVVPLVVAFIIAMFAQATVAKPYQIPSGSMLPTIQLDDRILANRVVYHFRQIERGDIVVFQPPANAGSDQGTPYVKRVIGLPGDTVEITKGKILINGAEFEVATASTPSYVKKPETVPDGMLFVLGDNRNESSDSHVWGYVPMDNVIGRADLIYWPPRNFEWFGW